MNGHEIRTAVKLEIALAASFYPDEKQKLDEQCPEHIERRKGAR